MEQHDQKFNQILEKMEEHDRKFNEILKRLDRHEEEIKRIWEKLEEHDKKFNEILAELREHRRRLEEHEKRLGSLGETLGILMEITLSERTVRELMRLSSMEGDSVELVEYNKMINYEYEVDVYMETRSRIYLVEIKSRPGKRDVDKLVRLQGFVAGKRRDKVVVAVLVSPRRKTRREIMRYAAERGVKLLAF